MSHPSRIALSLAALAASTLATSCDDNISCVFTTGCQGGSGQVAGEPATLPESGQLIRDGRPTVVDFAPDSMRAASTTPIVFVFSESMSEASLSGAFELVPIVNGFENPPITGLAQALVGDGQMLLLLPPQATGLMPADYFVRLATDAVVTDLTGQTLDARAGSTIGSFRVDLADPEEPALVASFPVDGATGQSETGEIIVVFDRTMAPASVTDESFDVQVDGMPPPFDPVATPIATGPGSELRVYRWRSLDADGERAPLGRDVQVRVLLSQGSATILEITDDMPVGLPPTIVGFRTSEFGAPVNATIVSDPFDAIGRANLTAGDPEELLFEVELAGALAGDRVDVFAFGTNLDVTSPQLVAVLSTVELAGMGTIDTAMIGLSDLDLLTGTDAESVRFAEGSVAFAFRQRRGGAVSPLTVLDVDAALPGIQDPFLDVTAPRIQEFLSPGATTASVRSDLRHIVLTGRASETLRAVEVSADPFGQNGALAPVVGSDPDSGLFIARPVIAGVLPPGALSVTAIAYDLALNPSAPVTTSFTQLGAVGPNNYAPGASLSVEVFDAQTLAGVGSALVLVHAETAPGVFDLVDTELTGGGGRATVTTAAAARVLLSIDAAGYELFTLDGVPSTRVSIPLQPTVPGVASVNGTVRVTSPLANVVSGLDGRIDDTRRPFDALETYPLGGCLASGPTVSCPFGPEPIRPRRLGAQSFLAGRFDVAGFSPATLIQAFDLVVPLPPTPPAMVDATLFEVDQILIEPDVPAEDLPFALSPWMLDATADDRHRPRDAGRRSGDERRAARDRGGRWCPASRAR